MSSFKPEVPISQFKNEFGNPQNPVDSLTPKRGGGVAINILFLYRLEA